MFNNMFSQILGSFGGAAAGGGQGVNPFSDVMGTLSGLVGGPGSESGTLFSLPGELATGIADLGTSENIIGDVMNLTKPIENLVSGGVGGLDSSGGLLGGLGGLGGLVGLNPFEPGPMQEVLRILGPLGLIAGASHLAAGHRRSMYGDEEE